MILLLLGVCSALPTVLSFIRCLGQTEQPIPPTLMLNIDVIIDLKHKQNRSNLSCKSVCNLSLYTAKSVPNCFVSLDYIAIMYVYAVNSANKLC